MEVQGGGIHGTGRKLREVKRGKASSVGTVALPREGREGKPPGRWVLGRRGGRGGEREGVEG